MVKKIVKKAVSKKIPAVKKTVATAVKKSKTSTVKPVAKKVIVKKITTKKVIAKKPVAKISAKVEDKKIISTNPEIENYIAYFGFKKALWYKSANDRKFAWSWWAFVFPVFYLLVRKSYIAALLWFMLFSFLGYMTVNPFIIFIAFGVVSALTLPYIVLARFKRIKTKVDIKTKNNTERLLTLACKGGKTYIVLSIVLAFYFSAVSYVVYEVNKTYEFLQSNPAEMEKFLEANPEMRTLLVTETVVIEQK